MSQRHEGRIRLSEGLPYQTLISSLLHKYASGRLKEIEIEPSACRTGHLAVLRFLDQHLKNGR